MTVNESLLASLDYGSKDPAVKKELETSNAVLAVLPTGHLTVRGLTRNIRFQYFHGIEDRPEAAEIRDRMFREWMIEGLLSFQAKKLGLDRDPDILAKARKEERRLVREQVLNTVLGGEFKPSEEEIRAYYESHLNDFIPPPRVKVHSVLAKTAETARRFRDAMDTGAQLKWLASRSPSEVDSIPPFPTDWMDAKMIGSKDQPLVEGARGRTARVAQRLGRGSDRRGGTIGSGSARDLPGAGPSSHEGRSDATGHTGCVRAPGVGHEDPHPGWRQAGHVRPPPAAA